MDSCMSWCRRKTVISSKEKDIKRFAKAAQFISRIEDIKATHELCLLKKICIW